MNEEIPDKRVKGDEKMPVLFIGHGSPMNVILDNDFTRSLTQLGRSLPRPKAIMVISAHWLTEGTYVTCMEHPRTIHDFYGFPEELYRVNYPSPGSPELAKATTQLFDGDVVCVDSEWGLDHASWAVLKHMYPSADIPVFEMSLDYSFNDWHPRSLQYHYYLASRLVDLRENGVLVIGSGNIVHNLRMIDFDVNADTFEWAREFDEKVKSNLLESNHEGLINFESMGGTASYAVPTLDHYLPMIYAIGMQREDDQLKFTYEGFQHGSVSMRCFQIG